jgi:glycolate oxidase
MDAAGLFSALARIYPADRLLTGTAEVTPHESDGLTAFRVKPAAVVLAEKQEEVIETVRLCARHRVLRYEPRQRIAVVEPGVINFKVSQTASPDGLYYAPDPSSGPVCTIGGNVAFNSGGAHCLKYGMTANHVLGLKVVLPDGEVAQLGGESLEAAGPDLVGMFIGSEGLFGIALEITLRLQPVAREINRLKPGLVRL